MDLTKPEKRLRTALRVFAALFFAATLVFLASALIGGGLRDWVQVGFVVNSVTKVSVLGALCLIAAADQRRFAVLVPVIVAAHFVSVAAAGLLLVFADTSARFELFGASVPVSTVLWAAIAMDGAIGALIWLLNRSARRARYGLGFLTPLGFEALRAVAEVSTPESEPAPEQVARNVDRYLSDFQARRGWITKWALVWLGVWPFLTGNWSLGAMEPARREGWLERWLRADVTASGLTGLRRTIRHLSLMLTQATVRLGMQLSYFGYYGDEASFDSIGYEPFSRRAPKLASENRVTDERLAVERLADLDEDTIAADVLIIGSGAAGATLAYRLAEAGRSVTVLERGKYLPPSQFSENEMAMLAELYADGALQLSRDFRFQVLQGMCVGGSTTVNNAVCFEIPPHVLEHWNTDLGAGLAEPRLQASFERVREAVGVTEQPAPALMPGGDKFERGVRELGLELEWGIVEANIAGCLGCGYCNIGCAYGAKLSMTETMLPRAQERWPERLRIVSECYVEKIERRNGGVSGVECRSGRRRVRAEANTVIVSAGAVNSSLLLLRSEIGGPRVGQGLSFNMGSPITAEFDEPLNAYAGLQISHYLRAPREQGYLMETWFNPPAAQAMAVPGWLGQHRHNMSCYQRLTALGVLVGTEANGSVRRHALLESELDFTPRDGDLAKLREGLKLAGRVLLAAGAERVMCTTMAYREFRAPEELDALDEMVRSNYDIQIGTGHPQGGNALSPDRQRGVVDPGFRVHGLDNLFVCDASVFPSSVTVNPQLTVMALADYAAADIA